MSCAERLAKMTRDMQALRSRLIRLQGESDSAVRDLRELQTELEALVRGGTAVRRFPRAEAVLEAAAAADMLRRAADALDELAGTAHQVEPGTLRRASCARSGSRSRSA
jgi:hypothetical protein